jgi:hypothetical protein
MPNKYTVIYVMADVRSGSTLLENILSKSAETVSVGELALLKGHILHQGAGFRWNWNCSCGSPVLYCAFWNNALKGIDVKAPDFNTSIDWNYRSFYMLIGSVLPVALKKALIKINARKINKDTIQTLNAIYKNIFQATGKSFIIDSSKDPVQAYMLYVNKPADVDIKIIGLTRDLRAIAASKRKWSIANKNSTPKSLMKYLSNSLFYKKIYNTISQFVKPGDVLMLNYEDLATNTQEELDKIVMKTGLQPYTAPQYMYVDNDHTIAGTPQRFTKRPIAYDNSWEKMYETKPVLSLIGKVMNKI